MYENCNDVLFKALKTIPCNLKISSNKQRKQIDNSQNILNNETNKAIRLLLT